MTYINKKVRNEVSYINYIALAIMLCWAEWLLCSVTSWMGILLNHFVCVLVELDRSRSVQAREESEQLQIGYTGRLRDADCSVPSDRDSYIASQGLFF